MLSNNVCVWEGGGGDIKYLIIRMLSLFFFVEVDQMDMDRFHINLSTVKDGSKNLSLTLPSTAYQILWLQQGGREATQDSIFYMQAYLY